MDRLAFAATCVVLAIAWPAPAARAAGEVVVECADAPAHLDCGKTQHFAVDAEAEVKGNEEFAKLKDKLYDPADPVAQVLSLSKWGDPAGWNITPSDTAFMYPIDKTRCIYAVAERAFYYDEGGPVEGGTNEITPRTTIYYLNNIASKDLTFQGQGIFVGRERLFLLPGTVDATAAAKGWAQVYAQYCKGK